MPVGYWGISQKHWQVQEPSSFWRAILKEALLQFTISLTKAHQRGIYHYQLLDLCKKILAMGKVVWFRLYALITKQPESGKRSSFSISRGEQINLLNLHSSMLPDSTAQQKPPTVPTTINIKSLQHRLVSTAPQNNILHPRNCHKSSITASCCSPALASMASGILQLSHTGTALAQQTVRESVCTGTSPTNWAFGFVGLFCFGDGERKNQFFL